MALFKNPFKKAHPGAARQVERPAVATLDISALDVEMPNGHVKPNVTLPDALTQDLPRLVALIESKIASGDYDEYAIPLIYEAFDALERLGKAQMDKQRADVGRVCDELESNRDYQIALIKQQLHFLDERDNAGKKAQLAGPVDKNLRPAISPLTAEFAA